MKKAPHLLVKGYDWGMEFTDLMLWKLGIFVALAFAYGIYRGFTGR
jgi:hypothetical protein